LRFRATIDRNIESLPAFEHLYWQAAGKDYKLERRVLNLDFERKYKASFSKYNTTNIWQNSKVPLQDQNTDLIQAMRHYDKTKNITG
jgi:tryptophan 2,3-dioxygenase